MAAWKVTRWKESTAAVALIALAIAIVLHFWWVSSATRETRALTATVTVLRDSVQQLRLAVDSLNMERPGLGDFMSTIQLHAAKLWFAGRAENWALAKYEEGELNETMDAAGMLHEKKNGVDITAVLHSVQQTQLRDLEQSIAGRNFRNFETAYDETLAACNGCHRPAGYAFIHIIRPTQEPVTNQQWKPAGG